MDTIQNASDATVGFGRRVINYLNDNRASLVATSAVAAGWGAAWTAGAKVAVPVCLVGGGMFATLVAHEAVKRGVEVGGSAIRNLRSAIRKSFAERRVPPSGTMQKGDEPSYRVNDQRAATGTAPM